MKTDEEKKKKLAPLELGKYLPPYSIWIPLERDATRISRLKRFKTRIKRVFKKKYRIVKE